MIDLSAMYKETRILEKYLNKYNKYYLPYFYHSHNHTGTINVSVSKCTYCYSRAYIVFELNFQNNGADIKNMYTLY